MNDFKQGDRAWWLSGVNMENCVGMGVQMVDIVKIDAPNSFTIRNDVTEFNNVEPSTLYRDKKVALAAAIKKFSEEPPPPPKPKTDTINHPVHYNSGASSCECGRKIECIDISKNYCFCLGNVIKYIWRYEHKEGLISLKKAQWYLNAKIKELEDGKTKKPS